MLLTTFISLLELFTPIFIAIGSGYLILYLGICLKEHHINALKSRQQKAALKAQLNQ